MSSLLMSYLLCSFSATGLMILCLESEINKFAHALTCKLRKLIKNSMSYVFTYVHKSVQSNFEEFCRYLIKKYHQANKISQNHIYILLIYQWVQTPLPRITGVCTVRAVLDHHTVYCKYSTYCRYNNKYNILFPI